MKNKLVSIIIPVYNVEKYIKECLDSIINQTYKNIEIILINDGSVDKSGLICDEYAQKDKRIITIHKENGGVSSARNLGLDKSTGEFILFVDPDDLVSKEYVYELIKNFNNNDMVSCGYYEKYANGTIEHSISDDYKIVDIDKANSLIFDVCGYRGFLWNKAFKSEIIKNNNIKFELNIHMCEDQIFVVNYLSHCNSIALISNCLYYYRIRTSSIVSGANTKKLLTIFDAYTLIYNYYNSINYVNIDFAYSVIWDYYNYKKIIDKKYYTLLNIKQLKKIVRKSDKISFFKKVKIFVNIHFKFIYTIRNKFRNNSFIKFD